MDAFLFPNAVKPKLRPVIQRRDSDLPRTESKVDGETQKKSRNFLLESGSASSESDCDFNPEEEGDPVSQLKPKCPPPACMAPPSESRTPLLPASSSSLSHKLPPPPLGASSKSGVFANPFKAQADQKLNVLQKHVPLTLLARPSQIGGKRMCVAYRKDGRCRFGIKCKFAHDSDLQSSIIPNEYDPPAGDDPGSDQADPNAGGFSYMGRQNFHHNQGGDPEEEGQQSRKRRVGLSNTLVPPKRSMKNYAMQRKREQVNLN
ncbi:uncharacterized protein isoform X1 [Salmo salar]|uniref:Uncharacterized protein isoform X1 n=1 Tax=Salmo salar TaxID=8030 RepID=A0A1S3SJI0_SALSA|nr:uncharacterized protein LOC106609955 isoform X1 [Salmo salar]|eukprot:XP_014064497.1 PREDICTED: uncharacterized protein LOC106609955 isoform X1 [Salmo salar]